MSDSSFPPPPPPPDPVVVTLWTGQLRSLLILAGGVGIGGTWLRQISGLTDAELSGYVATIVTVISFAAYVGPAVWSWIEKKWEARKARSAEVAAAKASAELGTPVTVTVTPKGVPNVATRISAAEQRAAPSVPSGITPDPAPRPAA